MTTSVSDVQAAEAAIIERRAELATAFESATKALREASAARDAAQTEYRRLSSASNIANAHALSVSRELTQQTPSAVLAGVASTETGKVDLGSMARLEALTTERARALRFLEGLAPFLQAAEEACLLADGQVVLAEAAQIDALVEQRGFELEVALAPVAETEGQLVVNDTQTVSGELRRRAAALRLAAANIRQRLSDLQATRRTLS